MNAEEAARLIREDWKPEHIAPEYRHRARYLAEVAGFLGAEPSPRAPRKEGR